MLKPWLAQVVSGAEAARKLTDETWLKPLGWWSIMIMVVLAVALAALIWRLILHSDKIDAALTLATEDKVKLASSSLTVIEQVRSELRELRDEVKNLTRIVERIWEYIISGGKK
jgi:hypothetical protein